MTSYRLLTIPNHVPVLLNSPDAALRIRIFSVLLTRSGKTLVEHPDNEKRSRVHTASSAIILVTSATKSTPPEPVIFCFLLPTRTATIFAAVAPAIFEQVRFAILGAKKDSHFISCFTKLGRRQPELTSSNLPDVYPISKSAAREPRMPPATGRWSLLCRITGFMELPPAPVLFFQTKQQH